MAIAWRRARVGIIVALALVIVALVAQHEIAAIAAGALLHPAHHRVARAAPAECGEVTFAGLDVALAGWRCRAVGSPRGTVVYLHGIADNRASAAGWIERLVAHGFDVVAYDSRAHGESDGNACTYGYFEKQDLVRVLGLRLHRCGKRRAGGVLRRMTKTLTGQVALVAGATRGAGRGIARALGEAGAFVYCTGRSVRGSPSPYQRPETLDETVEMIASSGGGAVAARVDHTVEADVAALMARIDRERGRLDVLVNSIAGEDPRMHQWGSFWKTKLEDADGIFRNSITSHLITSKHAAPMMIRAKRGLIVEVTENDILSAGGNPLTQTVKWALKGLALNMAAELFPHNVAAVAITPGFLRSESMLERLGVTEATWRDAGKKDPNFLESESPLFVGRAVAALAADANVLAKSGQLLSSWGLAREYQFSDYDGRRPDWGVLKIDWSPLPASFVQVFATGLRVQTEWLDTLAHRTREFARKLPKEDTEGTETTG